MALWSNVFMNVSIYLHLLCLSYLSGRCALKSNQPESSLYHSVALSLSFRFGRRSVLIWSYLQLGVIGCSSALSPSYSAYCIFRFLSGMAVSGVILNGVSLSTCLPVYLSVCLPVCHKLQVESLTFLLFY